MKNPNWRNDLSLSLSAAQAFSFAGIKTCPIDAAVAKPKFLIHSIEREVEVPLLRLG
jgi:hypothetical protein